jgi:DNA polymerase family A/3'-5' exonuclease
MNILTLDFETFFSDDYTLKKMTTEAYVRDERFEVLMVGIRWDNYQDAQCTETIWYGTDTIAPGGVYQNGILWSIDWDNIAVLCHHAHFDALILSHHYGIKPRFIYDTLSMARLLLGNHLSVGLESLARHFGLQGKTVPYDRFKGKRWADIDPVLRGDLGAGCLHDIDLTWQIFCELAKTFPQEEYQVVDMTVRMFTEPKLVGDTDVFAKVWVHEHEHKKEILSDLGLEAGDLQSADRFAELLRREGIEPETKSGKNSEIFAFAKTDQFMIDLLEHDDERVRTLAEARLGQKSTLDQTRAERLGFMATRGPMPVYLSYCGAHTTRWSGGDKVNWQNLKRGSALRKGCGAPAGYKIVKADKSQIECRILEMFAGEEEGIEEFRQGKDPYTGIASKFYGFEVTKEHKEERQFGKVMRLQCGFQAGGESIMRAAKRATIPVIITLEQGFEARDLYRSEKPKVKELWGTAGRIISALGGTNQPIQWGPLIVDSNCISLQGIPIWYPELHYHRDEESGEEYWRYKSRKGWVKLYGGKLVENVVQFMSRVDMSQSLLRILSRTNLRPAQLEHDAAVWVVPDDLVTPFVSVVQEEMTRAPVWLPDIPLAAEITVGETM